MSIRKDSKSLFHRKLKANEYPTKQTYTFMAVRYDCRKREKPVPENTPGRVAL